MVGSLLGSVNARRDIPLLVSLWQSGRLDLDGLITERRPIEQVNEAMDDLRAESRHPYGAQLLSCGGFVPAVHRSPSQ